MSERKYEVCTNCVMDTSDSVIQFDENGVCDHCRNFYENILPNWHEDEIGKKKLESIVNEIKKGGEGQEYDCIIGLSGGVDSSYLAYYAIEELGLRPLLLTVDTGWNLPVAEENTRKIIDGLHAKVHSITIDWEQMKDLQLAYFKSQVPYQDTPQDHAIFASLYNYATKHNIKWVLTGGNYSTECVREPNEWVYLNDLKQLRAIHKKFGTGSIDNIPQCSMFKYRLYYRYIKRMKIVRPLDFIPYRKEAAISFLEDRFGWERYTNKHFECIFTRFYEGYWLYNKFGYDKRRAHFSSLILTGQMTREEALQKLEEPPYPVETAMEDMKYICEKLEISVEDFQALMKEPNKTYKDYPNSAWISKLAIKAAILLGMEKRQFR